MKNNILIILFLNIVLNSNYIFSDTVTVINKSGIKVKLVKKYYSFTSDNKLCMLHDTKIVDFADNQKVVINKNHETIKQAVLHVVGAYLENCENPDSQAKFVLHSTEKDIVLYLVIENNKLKFKKEDKWEKAIEQDKEASLFYYCPIL